MTRASRTRWTPCSVAENASTEPQENSRRRLLLAQLRQVGVAGIRDGGARSNAARLASPSLARARSIQSSQSPSSRLRPSRKLARSLQLAPLELSLAEDARAPPTRVGGARPGVRERLNRPRQVRARGSLRRRRAKADERERPAPPTRLGAGPVVPTADAPRARARPRTRARGPSPPATPSPSPGAVWARNAT